MIKLKNVGSSKMIIAKDIALLPGESIEVTSKNSALCQSLNDKYPRNFSLVQEGVAPVKLDLPKPEASHLAAPAQEKKKESK